MFDQQIQPEGTVAIFGEVLADVFPDSTVLGGAPFNVARHLNAFGLSPLMISSIGGDSLGEQLMDEMARMEMETSGMQFDMQFPTGQVQVLLENGGHRFEILPDQAYDHINRLVALETIVEFPPSLFYFGTLAQRSLESRLTLEALIAQSDCPVFLDVNLRAPWYSSEVVESSLELADIVKLNDEELEIIADLLKLGSTSKQDQVIELKDRFNLEQVLVTCGASGSWMLDENHDFLPAPEVEMQAPFVDSVGAGDAYSAVFILGLLKQWPMSQVLAEASAFAAAICTVRGAVPADMAIYKRLHDLLSSKRKH